MDFVQKNRVFPVGEPGDDRLFQYAKAPAFELGGDITRPLGGGAIKLVGLHRRDQENLDTVPNRSTTSSSADSNRLEVQRGETLGRVSWSHSNFHGLNFEMGAEAAFNTLDADLSLFLLGANDFRQRIDLPIDQATVEEKRAEFYVKAGKQVSSAVRIDAGLNYEFSDLAVRGDATADRCQVPETDVTLDWKAKSGWHSQFSIRRTVAQLDFYDFMFGAIERRPDQRRQCGSPAATHLEVRATVDRPLFGSGLTFDLGDHISMLQDRILTEEGFDAPGNIGTGKRMFAHLRSMHRWTAWTYWR